MSFLHTAIAVPVPALTPRAQDLFSELDRLLFTAATYYDTVSAPCRREFGSLIAAVFKLNYKVVARCVGMPGEGVTPSFLLLFVAVAAHGAGYHFRVRCCLFSHGVQCSMEVRPAQIEKMFQLIIMWELDGLMLLTALRNLCTVSACVRRFVCGIVTEKHQKREREREIERRER
jgi:hypothetical protein